MWYFSSENKQHLRQNVLGSEFTDKPLFLHISWLVQQMIESVGRSLGSSIGYIVILNLDILFIWKKKQPQNKTKKPPFFILHFSMSPKAAWGLGHTSPHFHYVSAPPPAIFFAIWWRKSLIMFQTSFSMHIINNFQ